MSWVRESDCTIGLRLCFPVISKAMTSYLRGWKFYHGKPSPEFHPEDLSVDFDMLVNYLQKEPKFLEAQAEKSSKLWKDPTPDASEFRWKTSSGGH